MPDTLEERLRQFLVRAHKYRDVLAYEISKEVAAFVRVEGAEARLDEHKNCCPRCYPSQLEYESFGCIRRTAAERSLAEAKKKLEEI
jgi:hypothetical protein